MGIWRSLRASAMNPSELLASSKSARGKKARREREKSARRELQLERFEERLMLTGPRLSFIIPNGGELLTPNQVLNTSPTELTIRFNEGQTIDPNTLSGVQVARAGLDGSFGTFDDIALVPGYRGVGDRPNEVIFRFAETLPDDMYQITLVGAGVNAIRNTAGEVFNNGVNLTQRFDLELGTRVSSVVPQPVTRNPDGSLAQDRNAIDVYLDAGAGDINVASVTNPNFYKLIFTNETATNTDDVWVTPTSVSFDPVAKKVTLNFDQQTDLYLLSPGSVGGSFRLRIGDNVGQLPTPATLAPANDVAVNLNSTYTNALDINGSLNTSSSTSLIITGNIDKQPFQLAMPGSSDELGHRDIPAEAHLAGGADLVAGIVTYTYTFDQINSYGTDPQGNALFSAITETQKQRAREIFELYSRYLGVSFVEVASGGNHWVVTGDLRALEPSIPTGPGGVGGIAGGGLSIMDFAENWGNSEFGGAWFTTAMHEIGHNLGLGHTYDLPSITIMGSEGELPTSPGAEPVFPGDHDIVHGQYLYRPDSKDIDLYKFDVKENGRLNAEVLAERLSSIGQSSSLLDSVISLFDEQQILQIRAGSPSIEGRFFDISDGVTTKRFEFDTDGNIAVGATAIVYASSGPNSAANIVALAVADAIRNAGLNLSVSVELDKVRLRGPIDVNPSGLALGSAVAAVHSLRRELIARNDDYYSSDSLLSLELQPGRYYVGVTSTGNTNFDPNLNDSGFGGTTDGAYQLRLDFIPTATTTIVDVSGVAMDGDGNGQPGGLYNFWFKAESALDTIFVDKATTNFGQDGSLANPYQNIDDALAEAQSRVASDPTARPIVRIVGNGAPHSLDITNLADVRDGDTFTVTVGPHSRTFELEGDTTITVPAGNLLADGQTLTINGVVFEFNSANGVAAGSIAVPFTSGQTAAQVAATLFNAINTRFNGVSSISPVYDGIAGIQLRTRIPTVQVTGNVVATTNTFTAGLSIPAGNVLLDGSKFTLLGHTFEFDSNASIASGNIAVPFTVEETAAAIATRFATIANAAVAGTLGINATSVAGQVTINRHAHVIEVSGLTITGGTGVTGFNIPIAREITDTAQSIADRIAAFISASALAVGNGGNLTARVVATTVGPNTTYRVDITGADTVSENSAGLSYGSHALPYQIGFNPLNGSPLEDGSTMEIPHGVTVMIDGGAVFKMREANIDVGSSAQGIDRSEGALQVLGTPQQNVYFTSFHDDLLGIDGDPLPTLPSRGNWGGLVFRTDLDRQEPGRLVLENEGVFLNYVNHANMRYGGGTVFVNSTEQVFAPLHLVEARPTLTYNTIVDSATASISADPNSFQDSKFEFGNFELTALATAAITDGSIFVLRNIDNQVVRFEFDKGTGTSPGNIPVSLVGLVTVAQVRARIIERINEFGPGGVNARPRGTDRIVLSGATDASSNVLVVQMPQAFWADYERIGPDIYGNDLQADRITRLANGTLVVNQVENSINGLFVRIRTDQFGRVLDELELNARFNDTDIVHVIPENLIVSGTPGGPLRDNATGEFLARLDGRLAIDPNIIIKMDGARIEAEPGAQLLAEGVNGGDIIFTSLRDDRYGRGGTFDTNNNGAASTAAAGDWGGLYFGHNASGSIDHASVIFAGGTTTVEGGFANFNAVEIHQADVRIANTLFEQNAEGGAGQRGDRLASAVSTIFVRGAQPILLDNSFVNNRGPVVSINANAMQAVVMGDSGRGTGLIDRYEEFDANYGPLVRLNRIGNVISNPAINGMEVRGGTLTTASVWDDTDIVHVLQNEIIVGNHHTYSGIRLQSAVNESLVVKLQGATAGFTATGIPLDIDDRVGGTVQILGAPGFPVVLTSLSDDTSGAGFTPSGIAQTDTNNDGVASSDDLFFPPSGNDLVVTPTGNGVTLVNAMLLRPLAPGVAINNATYVGGTNSAGTYVNGDGVPLEIYPQGTLITNGNAVLPTSNTINGFPGFTGVMNSPGDASLDGMIASTGNTTTEAGVLTITFFVDPASGIRSGRFNFQFGSEEYSQFVGSDFNDVVGAFVNGGANFLRDSQGNLVTINSGFFDIDNEANPAYNIEYDGMTSSLLATFPVQPGVNTLKIAIGDVGDRILDSGVFVTDLRFSNQDVGAGGVVRSAAAGDWRSVRLDSYGNDRNVATVLESELSKTGGAERNGTPATAEQLGALAPNEKSGDDNLRLGFQAHGNISLDAPGDVDVYSFQAQAGTEVWLDIDRTAHALDTVLELVLLNGTVIARSDNSFGEHVNSNFLPDISPGVSNLGRRMIRNAFDASHPDDVIGQDFYSQNPLDAGMRVVLPGAIGTTGTYYVRVRSNNPNLNDPTKLHDGVTKGEYTLQVRLRELDEVPGSTVRRGDIRYAANGIEVLGMPGHSPLLGEAAEQAVDNNNTFNTAQPLGNLLTSDRNTISVGGNITDRADVDWFQFQLDYDLIQAIGGFSGGGKTWATIFDIDYADGISRADLTLSVFDQDGRLIFVGRDSDVADDQAAPTEGADLDDLTRGSAGKLDPYISNQLREGTNRTYYVAVSSNAYLPAALNATFQSSADNSLIRLEPVSSLKRIVEDHIGFIGYTSGDTLLGGVEILPETTRAIIDISNSQRLATHIRPFSLSDVTLYVSANDSLHTIDASTGRFETTVAGGLSSTNVPTRDISIRSDGAMYAYQGLWNPNTANTAGRLVQLNPDTGAVTGIGNDGVPDDPFPGAFDVGAMAWRRNGFANYDLYYAFHFGGSSYLARANPDNGATNVANTPFTIRGEIDTGALVTGMAFIGGQLYGVDAAGNFFTIDEGGNPTILNTVPGANFAGLTLAPQNLDFDGNGVLGDLANNVIAITSDGTLYCFNADGSQRAIFDSNEDGVLENFTTIFGVGGVTGLAFTPLDVNLWHPTEHRNDDAGHGVNNTPDFSRVGNFGNNIRKGETNGGASLYFGLEEWVTDPNGAERYMTYTGNSQYGFVPTLETHRDLTRSNTVGDNYNVPGGAKGSLVTGNFSLEGYAATDKPTLYFNYFLATQGAQSASNGMRDSARVFASDDGGITWQMLATNNSQQPNGELPRTVTVSRDFPTGDPRQGVQELFDTGSWRQARIDLADFAGSSNVILRFDFSTSGSMFDPGLSLAANELLPGDGFGDSGSAGRGQNNQHEGFYVDDIIVGFAERGEMVTAAAAGATTHFQVPQAPSLGGATEVLTGPYQLEIRRGKEYADSMTGTLPSIVIDPSRTYDTNDRLATGFTITPPGDFRDSRGVGPFGPGALPTGAFNVPFTGLPTIAAGDARVVITVMGDLDATDERMTVIVDGITTELELNHTATQGGVSTTEYFIPMAELNMLIANGSMTFAFATDGPVNGIRQIRVDIQYATPIDGTTFTIADSYGGAPVLFEYDTNNSLINGSATRVNVATATTEAARAAAIAAAVNGHPSLRVNAGTHSNSNKVELHGATFVSNAGSPLTLITRTEFNGDKNLHREQGYILIQGNKVSHSAGFGIVVDQGVRTADPAQPHPGGIMNQVVLNNQALVPGISIENNLLVRNGAGGIRFSGDANPSAIGPRGAVPFGRIMNNTIYGTGGTSVGIQVDQNAGPTILNNILANLGTGIRVDASSVPNTVVGGSLYQGNASNSPDVGLGSFALVLPNNAALFIDPIADNFYLKTGSQAIDSSINSLQERAALAAVTSPLGIPQSPILAPELDLLGQTRRDDPAVNPPFGGLGSDVFKDRGALERADFVGPTATLRTPRDNDAEGRDQDPTVTTVFLVGQTIETFEIQLVDEGGVGIDDATVNSGKFRLTRNGFPLVETVDYLYSYDATNNLVRFTSTSGVWLNGNVYDIEVLQGTNPILDQAQNPLRANQPSGRTTFRISLTEPENDVPQISFPSDATTNEDTAMVFEEAAGNPIRVFDVDSTTNDIRVTLTATNGTVTLSQTTGLVLITGDGTGDAVLSFEGTIAEINAALEGLQFIPTANFNGQATLEISADDRDFANPPGNMVTTVIVNISVVPVADAPVPEPFDVIHLVEDQDPVTVDLSDLFSDVDILTNDDFLTLTVIGNSTPSVLTASITPGTFTLNLMPAPDGSGIVTLSILATDSFGLTAVAIITVDIEAINDPPVVIQLIPDQVVLEDAADLIFDLMEYFHDPDIATSADVLTFQVFDNTNQTLVNAFVQGNNLILDMLLNQNGSANLTITATDLALESVSTSFNLTVLPVEDVPLVTDDEYAFNRGQPLVIGPPGVLANDADPDGSPIIAVLIDVPQHGSVVVNANGSFTYTPDPGFNGVDSFVYAADDGTARTEATVSLFTRDALWVRKLYQQPQLLNRTPSAAEINYWTSAIPTIGYPGIANSFVSSPERRNLFIDQLYQQYLGRPADVAGLNFWRGVWAANNGPERVQAGIIGSQEFFNTAAALRPHLTPNAAWVVAMYDNILGRPNVSQAEINYWVSVMQTRPRSEIVMGFVTSDEYRLNLINGWYQDYLGRTTDAAGAQFWLSLMRRGLSQEAIQNELLSSAEYRNNV